MEEKAQPNPQNGEKIISVIEFIEQSGFGAALKAKGITLNPTHDFEKLKSHRLGLFEDSKKQFTKGRSTNKLETTDYEISYLYGKWLASELIVIAQWLSDKYPTGKPKPFKLDISTELEITKYRDFVKSEIVKCRRFMNTHKLHSEIAGTEYDLWLSLNIENKIKYSWQSFIEKFPNGSREDFFAMESEHQISTIRKLEEKSNRKWWETKWLVEAKKFLKYIQDFSSQSDEVKQEKSNSFPAKYYALYHWIRIEMGKDKAFEMTQRGGYPKSEIMAFATQRYPETSSAMFYIEFKGIDITNKTAIANTFGKGYKEKIITISNHNTDIILHLKKFPN